jgi:hypothetical protein
MIRNSRAVAAVLQLLHNLASCLLLRFSSARRNIPLRVHRISPHRQMLLPDPSLYQIPTIPCPQAAAPASEEEEEDEEDEEEAETEEVHHRLLRPRIREESIQSYVYCIAHHHGVIRNCPYSSAETDHANFLLKGVASFVSGESYLSRSFYFRPGATVYHHHVPLLLPAGKIGAFVSVSYPGVGADTQYFPSWDRVRSRVFVSRYALVHTIKKLGIVQQY